MNNVLHKTKKTIQTTATALNAFVYFFTIDIKIAAK